MPRLLTVDAVIMEGEKVLLVRRKKAPFRGSYALPGGYAEAGETLAQAVKREAKEETGLDVEPVRMIGIYDDPARDARGNVTLAFLCAVRGGELRAGSDAGAARFFAIGRLPAGLAFDHARIIADAIEGAAPGETPGRKVLAGGVFNMIHPGHRHFLGEARKLGDELIVVVASDRTARRRGKMLLGERERAGLVASVSGVDRVVIGDPEDMSRVVIAERPAVIALGYDQESGWIRQALRKGGLRSRVVRIGQLKGYSTRKIRGGRRG